MACASNEENGVVGDSWGSLWGRLGPVTHSFSWRGGLAIHAESPGNIPGRGL